MLDAALELFIANGFAATRVEDVARRAGLSKGAVYLYFPSKEALLEGLVRRAVTPIATQALEQLGHFEGDPRIAISATLRMVATKLVDPKLIAIPRPIMREVVQFPELAIMYRNEVLNHVLPVAERLIARGIAQGYLRPVDPELTVRSIVGPIALHLILAEVFQLVPEDGLAMDRLLENHLSILFDGMSLPGGSK